MNAIDRDTLLRLAGRSEWPSASIYLPVDHTGAHTDADRIRLRNLAKQACERLVVDGLREPAADAMLAATQAVIADDAAWAGGPSGLAVFITPDSTDVLWVDVAMPETFVVGDRFYTRPLYAAYTGEKKAWALALDTKKTRLFHMDAASIEEVEFPKSTKVSLADDLAGQEHEESLQYHTVPAGGEPGSHGAGAAMYNGHGGEKDYDAVERGQFMIQLCRGLVERIGAGSAEPLVLMGVAHMVDEFHAICSYAHTLPAAVHGATDYLSAADVHRKVLETLRPAMESASTAMVDEYRELAGTGRTSSDAAEILAAAAGGRVKTLIMDDSVGPWGWFDRENFAVTHLCDIEPRYLSASMGTVDDPDVLACGWDLIDLAAAETFAHGGSVLAFRGESAPFAGAVAVFRY
jgi:hypothetical protein